MKAVKTITSPEGFQLLADETRRKIIYLLRVKEMTVSQIAEELDVTPQAVYHHTRKLLAGGLIEVVREERLGHLIESYYRTTAWTFNFTTEKVTPHSRKLMKEQEIAALNGLKKLGFDLEFDEKQVDQLINVGSQIEECCSTPELEDKISNLDIDFPTQLLVTEYAAILSMSETNFEKEQELRKKLRDALMSLLKKK